jgi:maltooligosyltrehalose trehalohydrolase
MLFQGEEWGATTPFLYFSDHRDPKLAAAAREGRRREFSAFGLAANDIPDPQAHETFARSKLNWGELSQPQHTELLDWHKKLISLRQSNPGLRDGSLKDVVVRFDENEFWLTMERRDWTIVCNLGPGPFVAPLRKGKHQLVAGSDTGIVFELPSVTLPSDSVAILKQSG